MDEIVIKLSIDGTTGNVSLQATDKNLQQLVKSVGDANKATNTFSENFVRSFQNMRNLGQGFEQAWGAMTSIFGAGIKKAMEYELSLAKLSGVIRSGGKDSEISAAELEKTAIALSKSSLFFKSDILDVQRYFLSFKNIGAGSINEATMAAMGLTQVLGLDLRGATIALAKGLDQGSEGMKALNRMGLKLSSDELDHVKNLENEGKTYQMQSYILTLLASKYKNVAEEIQKTDAFKFNQAEKALGDMQKQAGAIELITLGPMLTGLSNLLNAFGKVDSTTRGIIVATGELTVAYAVLASTGIGQSVKALLNFDFGMKARKIATLEAKLVTNELTVSEQLEALAAIQAANATKGFWASMGPIGWGIIAVTLFTTAWGLLDNAITKTSEAMSDEEKKIREQQLDFNRLAGIIKDTTKSETERGKAIDEISNKYPEYINHSELDNASQKTKNELLARGNDLFEQRIKIISETKVLQGAMDKLVQSTTDMKLSQIDYDNAKAEENNPGKRKELHLTGYSAEAQMTPGGVTPKSEMALDILNKKKKEVEANQKEYDTLHNILIGDQDKAEKPEVTAKKLLDEATKTTGWTGIAVDNLVKSLQEVRPKLVRGSQLWKDVQIAVNKLGKDDIGAGEGSGTKPMLDEAKLNLQNVTEISDLYSSIDETWNKIDKSQAKDSKGLVDTKKTDQERLNGKYKIREDLEKEIDALMKSKVKFAEVTAESRGEDKIQTLQDKLQTMQSVMAEVDRQSKIWNDKGRGNFQVIPEQKKLEWGNDFKKLQNDLFKAQYDEGDKQLSYDEDMISKRMEIDNAGEMQRVLLKESYLNKQLDLAIEFNQEEKIIEINHQLEMNQLDKEATAKRMLERTRQLQYELQISKAGRTKIAPELSDEHSKDILGENKSYDEEKTKINEDPLLTENQKSLSREELEKAHQERLFDIKRKYYDAWLGELFGLSRKEIEGVQATFSQLESAANSLMSMQSKKGQGDADGYRKTENEKLDTQKKAALSHARTAAQKDKIEAEYAKKKDKIDAEANAKGQERVKTMFAIQKALSITNAIISTYEGADKALATYPPPIGAILMAATIAAGLANVAVISSQEMPKFAVGGLPEAMMGMSMMIRPNGLISGPGSGTSDSILARISNKEFIVNAEATAKHRSLLENLNIGRFSNGGFAGGLSYSSSHISHIDTGATEELKALRNEVKDLTTGLNNALDAIANIAAKPAAIGDRECSKITDIGLTRRRKNHL